MLERKFIIIKNILIDRARIVLASGTNEPVDDTRSKVKNIQIWIYIFKFSKNLLMRMQ